MIEHLKSLAVFAEVVEQGSFRGAARSLELSPSVISHHINNLEKKLGTALLYRSPRVVSVTTEGQRLYESAAAMVSTAEEGLGLFSESADRLIDLRVTIPNMLVGHPIFRKISNFGIENPGIRLNLLTTDVSINLLQDKVDVAIRVGRLRDADIKARKIGEDRRVTVAAPSLIKRYPALQHPKDLNQWNCISFSSVSDEYVFRKGSTTHTVWGNTAAVTDSVLTMQELAVGGIGVAGVPFDTAQHDIASNKLVELLPEWQGIKLSFYALWARNATLNKHTRRFIDALV